MSGNFTLLTGNVFYTVASSADTHLQLFLIYLIQINLIQINLIQIINFI